MPSDKWCLNFCIFLSIDKVHVANHVYSKSEYGPELAWGVTRGILRYSKAEKTKTRTIEVYNVGSR